MISQIKNIFRGGKRHESKTNIHEKSSNHSNAQRNVTEGEANNAKQGDDRHQTVEYAARLMKEDKIRRQKLPKYPGLERFDIVEKLGEGAFSVVYKARDTTTGDYVAVKVVRKRELDASKNGRTHLHPSIKKKPRATERANILKEVQIMQNVKHENLVHLVHFSESEEYYFLAMQLCTGGELFHRIVKLTYFSEPLARHVITQVAEGIRYLHEECGVVHRDIKPENILFEPIPIIPSKEKTRLFDEDKEDEGEFIEGVGGGGVGLVKIADFGLSKVIWDNSTLTPCGTVGYTAPEIVRDQQYSKGVDMWALGCVLYTMLCGFPPFYDESIRMLTEKVARGQYSFLSPWWDPISAEAKDLISKLLCVDPKERYTTKEFFNHPWVQGKKFAAPTVPAAPAKPATPELVETDTKRTRRKDAFSPGVASIKEILDITYAVQRMGEENPDGPRYRAVQNGVILEEDEDEDEEEGEGDGEGEERKPVNPAKLMQQTPLTKKPFSLDMNKATLLKKRQQPPPA